MLLEWRAKYVIKFLKNIGLSIELIRGNILTEKIFLLDDRILPTIDHAHVLRRSRKGTNIMII